MWSCFSCFWRLEGSHVQDEWCSAPRTAPEYRATLWRNSSDQSWNIQINLHVLVFLKQVGEKVLCRSLCLYYLNWKQVKGVILCCHILAGCSWMETQMGIVLHGLLVLHRDVVMITVVFILAVLVWDVVISTVLTFSLSVSNITRAE